MLPPLLVDANVAAQVVAYLRSAGVDVESVIEQGWGAWTDDEILAESVSRSRFVLTHDSDFGRLALAEGKPYHGILHLRPGDERPAIVVDRLRALHADVVDWSPPMIAVYRRGRLRIRRPRR